MDHDEVWVPYVQLNMSTGNQKSYKPVKRERSRMLMGSITYIQENQFLVFSQWYLRTTQ